MDDLFVVYRYLALNRHKTDEDNPYSVAFETLDAYVDIEREIAYYANKIRSTGGLGWGEAKKLTERILTGFEIGLLSRHHGTTLSAAIDFMQKYISLDDIGLLIEACQKEKARMIREEDEESARAEEEEHLFALDSGEGIEDQ